MLAEDEAGKAEESLAEKECEDDGQTEGAISGGIGCFQIPWKSSHEGGSHLHPLYSKAKSNQF